MTAAADAPARGGAPGLISVIVIFLNEERFLGEALASIFAQTHSHWELLLVDDGSTDGGSSIARACAAAHPDRVRYLEHAAHVNRGMSASRNLGVAAARGEFIAFLDGDDVYLPQKLERQTALLAGAPGAAMVYAPVIYWHSWNGRPEDAARDRSRPVGVAVNTIWAPPALSVVWVRQRAMPPATSGVLIRRSALEQIGGSEESFATMYEDQVLFHKLALAFPVLADAEPCALYRQHLASATHADRLVRRASARPGAHPPYIAFLEWLDAYVMRRHIGDATLRRAVRRELWTARHPRVMRAARRARALVQAGLRRAGGGTA